MIISIIFIILVTIIYRSQRCHVIDWQYAQGLFPAFTPCVPLGNHTNPRVYLQPRHLQGGEVKARNVFL